MYDTEQALIMSVNISYFDQNLTVLHTDAQCSLNSLIWQFSLVQFKIVSTRSGKPKGASPPSVRLQSEVSTMLPLKHSHAGWIDAHPFTTDRRASPPSPSLSSRRSMV